MPSLLDPIIAPLNKLLRTSYVSHPFLIESGLEDHQRILTTLQDHDADRAYQEMLRHLAKGEQELLELGVTQEAMF
jgi:DNA-binding FadR family transcriptional regulator